jgi:PAS domain S-box-containing protein
MKIFSAPTFADERQTLAARKVWAVLVGLIATVTPLFLALILALPANHLRSEVYLLLFDGSFLVLLFLSRFGRPRLAATLLIAVMATILSVSAWTGGGVRAPGMMAFLLLVGIAGTLEGPRAAAITAGACGAISLGLLRADLIGLLPPPLVHHTSTSVWVVLIFMMAEFVMVQVVVDWVVRRAEERSLASVNERQRAEAALRESESKFAKVFSAGPDAMAISELETGRIIEANANYVRLLGYCRDELVGRTTLELDIFEEPRDRPRLIAAIRADGAVRDWELRFRTRSRTSITVLYSGEVTELGGRTHLVSVIHDITERKRAEARERQAREDFTRRLIASQEAERRRIAGELHDSLGQNLILIKNRAELALELADASPEIRLQFQNLREMAAQAITEVRQISHDLRPYQLDQLGLTRALEAMIDTAARNSQFPIARKLDAVDDLFTPEAATHLYRVAQESLSNILKHARAKSARVGLERDVRAVRLWIEDNGQGFAAGPAKGVPPVEGLGLSSIAERARILGATLRIDSVPGQGTRIELAVPHTGGS